MNEEMIAPEPARPARVYDFSEALKFLKEGLALSRTGWNRPHFLRMQRPDVHSKMTLPYLYMVVDRVPSFEDRRFRGPSSEERVPWVASHSDILGEDWFIVSPQ